jgi:hypothetical protein
MTQNTCENCILFNEKNHSQQQRTKRTGICQKTHEIVFYSTKSCKSFHHAKKWEDLDKLEIKNPTYNNQINLFQ